MNSKADKRRDVMEVLKKYGLDSSAVWDCHGTPVILHKALEKVADEDGIVFDPPQIIEASAKDKIAVVCVTGRKGDASAWSFGEAAPSNNKNAYPFAMAEKRAKDRVILKLIGLSGDVYSEEEADDFKSARPSPAKPAPVQNVRVKRASKASSRPLYSNMQEALDRCGTLDELNAVYNDPLFIEDRKTLPEDWETSIIQRKHELEEHFRDKGLAA